MRSAGEIARLTEELVTAAAAAGLLMRSAEDEELDGRTVRLDGRSRLNFGSCTRAAADARRRGGRGRDSPES
ncbi:hypothetical protein [Nocardia brasiliensis]|uniref:hypothetical protein n=1 Tax=Nocardia brasiliensis TaxID=37326 RepID=UPI0024577DBE|nr:hypothetical protein [Nocardia brasiliensis]